MKHFFAFFLCLALSLQPYSAEAARSKKTSTKKLSSYILPYKQIVKMSPEDQVKYFMLLHSLVAQIEMRQIFHYTTKKSKTKAFLDFLEQNLKTSAYANSQSASPSLPIIVLPNNPLSPRSADRLGQFGTDTFRLTRASWESLNDPFATTRFPQGALLTPAAIERRLAEAEPTLLGALQATPVTTDPATAQRPDPITATGMEDSDVAAADAKVETETPQTSKPVYKKEGAGCIFAGHFSKYKLYGDKLFCEPKGLNDPKCEGGSKDKPKVSCYTFNLKKSNGSDFLACTDYKPIDQLTINCNKAFIDAFQKALPAQMDAETYEKWRAQIAEEIDNLTRPDIEDGFYNYCLEDNKRNGGIQKNECASVRKTVEDLDLIINKYGNPTPSATQPAAPTTGNGKK